MFSRTLKMESKFCQQERTNISIEDGGIKAFFVTLYIVCGMFGTISNLFVIFVMKVTNQLQNQSIKLLMFLSFADLFSSIATFIRLALVYIGKEVECKVLGWTYFLYLVSIYCTNYLFALTGFDRFLRVVYLEEYGNKFTKSRFFILMAWYLILVLIQAGLGAYLNFNNHIGYAGSYTMILNVIVVCLVIVLYILSIIKLQYYTRMNQSLSDATKAALKITMVYLYDFQSCFCGIRQAALKITMVYLYLFFFLTVSSVVYQVVLNQVKLSEDQQLILQNVIGLLPTVLGSINAVTFIVINPLAKAYAKMIKQFVLSHFHSRVDVVNNNA